MTAARSRDRFARHGSSDQSPHERALVRICGLAAVAALFERDPKRVERLFFEPRLRGIVGGFCVQLARAHKPYREVEAAELTRVAGTVLHGGIAAIARARPLADFDPSLVPSWASDGKPILVLDGIGNPHNLGAIARTAAFFGIEHMLLADRPEQALLSDASYRIAEGGLEYITLYRASLPKSLRDLAVGYRVLGTALGLGTDPARLDKDKPAAIVLGNEETGLDHASLAACDAVVTIPGSGNVQSLNVAAAAAILIYTLTRS